MFTSADITESSSFAEIQAGMKEHLDPCIADQVGELNKLTAMGLLPAPSPEGLNQKFPEFTQRLLLLCDVYKAEVAVKNLGEVSQEALEFLQEYKLTASKDEMAAVVAEITEMEKLVRTNNAHGKALADLLRLMRDTEPMY
ncbi:hypothetical protein RQP46_010389 [Phenoliferia psychrophenolica]